MSDVNGMFAHVLSRARVRRNRATNPNEANTPTFVADDNTTQKRITMSLVAASRMASRPIARQNGPQRRSFLTWMTNYPDKVSKKRLFGRDAMRQRRYLQVAMQRWAKSHLETRKWRMATENGMDTTMCILVFFFFRVFGLSHACFLFCFYDVCRLTN
jgi:hypothetical protein